MIRPALVLALCVLVMASAVGVVYSQHESRLLFTRIQQLQHQLDEAEIEWGRLELEQSTLSAHGSIEQIARERLGMRIPEIDEVQVLVQ